MKEDQKSRYNSIPKSSIALLFILFVGLSTAAVTSVDQIEYDSNSQFFDGEVFVVDFINSFDTDRIDVFLDKSRLDQSTDGEVEQDLQIYTNSQTQYARYSIGSSARRDLINLEPVTNTIDDNPSNTYSTWIANNCYDLNQDGSSEYVSKPVLSWDGYDYKIYCSTQNGKYGSIGDINSPDSVFEIEWCVEATGESRQCETISNGEAGQGVTANIGNNVKIRFGGAFTTGNGAPIADDELAIHSNTIPEGWKIISESRYDSWDNYVSNTLWNRYQDWADSDVEFTKSTLNSEIKGNEENAYSTFTQSPFNDAQVLDSSFSNGQLKVDTDTLGYPQSTVYVDAGENGYVRVSKPVGKPSVTSTSGDKFGELESGIVSATVENIGDGEGSFSGRLTSCSSGFSFDDNQRTVTLSPGDSITYDFRVSFSSQSFDQKEVSGSCDFEVTETGSGSTDSRSISLTGVQENECEPGNQIVKVESGNEVIYECSSDGLSLNKVESCNEDETAKVQNNGEYQCVEETEPPITGGDCELAFGIPDPVCKITNAIDNTLDRFGTILGTFDIVASLAVGIISFGFTATRLGDFAAPVISEATPATESVVRLLMGLTGFIAGTYLAFVTISSLFVKVFLVLALVLGGYLYLKIEAVIPG